MLSSHHSVWIQIGNLNSVIISSNELLPSVFKMKRNEMRRDWHNIGYGGTCGNKKTEIEAEVINFKWHNETDNKTVTQGIKRYNIRPCGSFQTTVCIQTSDIQHADTYFTELRALKVIRFVKHNSKLSFYKIWLLLNIENLPQC